LVAIEVFALVVQLCIYFSAFGIWTVSKKNVSILAFTPPFFLCKTAIRP